MIKRTWLHFKTLRGEITLRFLANGFAKFIVANATVVLAIMLLPVFLVTDNVSFFEEIMDYLFSNKS